MTNSGKLLQLALKTFGNLKLPERRLFEQIGKGEAADYTVESDDEDANDPAKASGWDDDRVIGADRIAWLLTDPEASKLVTHRGIMIEGARIDGELVLEDVSVPYLVALTGCRITQRLVLRNSELRSLSLRRTHTEPIEAVGLTLSGDILLSEGFHANGGVTLLRATVGGNLVCRGGHFRNSDGNALSADGAKVTGGVFLNQGFEAEGMVRLRGATIGTSLECGGGHFRNSRGEALTVDHIAVTGRLALDHGIDGGSA